MWFFVLIFNIFILFIFYKIFNRRIIKNSTVDDLIEKYRNEVNSIIVSFNKTSFENINLLEEKINELRNLLKLMEKKTNEYKRLIDTKSDIIAKNSNIDIKKTKKDIPDESKNKVKKSLKVSLSSKASLVLQYFEEGYSIRDIAKKMGIPQSEVKLYIRRIS